MTSAGREGLAANPTLPEPYSLHFLTYMVQTGT